jgi:phospho-N-acetylmuramoyl-pentapeptide-transferase
MNAAGVITSTAIPVPFFGVEIELGIFYWVFCLFFIAFTINSVNLTDGIDGLAGSVTLAVSIFFAAVLFSQSLIQPSFFTARLTLVGGLIGGLIGFLFYNIHPARIFMGDTGSLFLGGAVVGLSFLIGQPLIIAIVGLIYFVEVFSVMIQVFFFKLTGKRVFKMSPIHHHFEMCGWGEQKIVFIFTFITLVLCALSYFAF